MKQVIISSDDTAGVLIYSRGFLVISNIKSTIDCKQQTIFTGHFGDSLARIMPIEVNSNELLGEVLVLVQNLNANDSTFEHRKAMTHKASDFLAGVEGGGFTSFGNTNLDNEPELDDMSIVMLPTVIPLPFSHGIECTSASDRQAILSLVSKLDNINERLVTWVYVMHFSINHFDGVLLNHGSLNINLRASCSQSFQNYSCRLPCLYLLLYQTYFRRCRFILIFPRFKKVTSMAGSWPTRPFVIPSSTDTARLSDLNPSKVVLTKLQCR
jgi:hypothetical protein